MKALANKKLLGIAIGERSLMVAEVTGGDHPQVKQLAEMVYPEGVSLADPAVLGTALSNFLKQQGFASRSAVIGIPVKWIVVKTKEVPPTDAATLAPLLRACKPRRNFPWNSRTWFTISSPPPVTMRRSRTSCCWPLPANMCRWSNRSATPDACGRSRCSLRPWPWAN